MTSITSNLPWFIREPAVSLIGEKCYVSLVENLNIADVECLKYALSKGLGLGIVVGGSIVKVPQVLLIVNARSARGLSLPAYVLETLSYAITLAYSYRNQFPFSTYGENLFLTIQNAIITVLIVYLPTSYASLTRVKSTQYNTVPAAITALVSLLVCYALTAIPSGPLQFLQASTLPLSVLSKLPQIQANARARSTGQLSAFAVGAQIAGCAARLFTTATEVGDSLVFGAFALALILNCVLGFQMWMYWGKGVLGTEPAEKHEYDSVPLVVVGSGDSDIVGDEKERSAWNRQMAGEAIVHRATGTPPPMAGGRKWARKVD